MSDGTLFQTGFGKWAKSSLDLAIPNRKGNHSLYVVELDSEVRLLKKFLAANPHMLRSAPCFYVGLTGLTPQARFERHQSGIQSSGIVKKYGTVLRTDFFELLNPLTYAAGKVLEPSYADWLRAEGFGVWQN